MRRFFARMGHAISGEFGRNTERPYRRGVIYFLIIISFVGFIISFYLTLMHYRGSIPRCYIFQGCDVVQTSRYSAVIGIPLALPGTIFFAVMFYLGIGVLTNYGRKVTTTYRVLAYLGALAVIPLFLLQALVLKAFCSYCLVTEIIMLSMWITSFALSPLTPGEDVGEVGSRSYEGGEYSNAVLSVEASRPSERIAPSGSAVSSPSLAARRQPKRGQKGRSRKKKRA